ncbi:hypothetical protein BCV69DRAFT_282610 [Microstroma glucosiphilum]|uniref:FZ domain-containing protein n=1 Tax=Pseudomicrostroma glucosiphilum TaxID=1684307 RepID=A0A316U9N1_9BASI|nr:hypothetical protein BCV69DRAFT_282610 [Pseudomicrostroma glucosiphilum]PWN21113.1 hypothetical protein BCV69DRAFT_282610 [Pseudomicrostroma glucosiphilum]
MLRMQGFTSGPASQRVRCDLRTAVRCLIVSLICSGAIVSSSTAHAQVSTYTELAADGKASPVVATQIAPYALTSSVAVRSVLNISSDGATPALFTLPLSEVDQGEPINVAVSLCNGPTRGIAPPIAENASSSDRAALEESSLVRVYVSINANNPRPGPDSSDIADMVYARGGLAQIRLNEEGSETIEEVWVAIWPPEEAWGETGAFEIEVLVNPGAPQQQLHSQYGILLEDTDSSRALVTTFNYTAGQSPNVSLMVLPSVGDYALPSTYYNSSFCAIADAWNTYAASSERPVITSSETTRGRTQSWQGNDQRMQFEIGNLDSTSNYTAWLLNVNSSDSNVSSVALYPAIKFKTKQAGVCRLVWDIDFCPEVAYSIPLDPVVATEDALNIINETVTPNLANFSKTLSTWSCNDTYFGQYSTVQSCTNCLNSYRDWLCAIAMPRCTDPVESQSNGSAAISDVDSLTGRSVGSNTELLPYVLNRNVSDTRQSYIDNQLDVDGPYGEVLPCLYTCLFVQRNCPGPLLSWTCPRWDITAQHDYGTFADAGANGLGAGENGGAGSDMARWGGPLRYIAQDAFGNTYCNAMGVDTYLREQNTDHVGGVDAHGDSNDTVALGGEKEAGMRAPAKVMPRTTVNGSIH